MTRTPEPRRDALREAAERHLAAEGRRFARRPELEPEELLHELEVHRAELEMQNARLAETTAELEEARDRYHDLYDFAPVPHVTLDDRGVVREANRAAVEMLGLTGTLLVGQPLAAFVADSHRQSFWRCFRHCPCGDKPCHCELRLTPRGAEPRRVELRIAREGQGDVRIALIDLTDRDRRERAERSAAEVQAILDNTADAVVIADAAGRILYHNPASLALHGYAEAAEANRSLPEVAEQWELFTLDGPPLNPARWPLQRALAGERFSQVEVRARRPDTGHEFIGSFSGTPVLDDRGEISRAVLIVRDVTARKWAEMAVRTAEHRLRLALDGGKLATWDRNLTTDQTEWHPRLYEMLGRDPDTPVTGETFFEYIHPDDLARVRRHLDETLRRSDEFVDEFRVVREDGEVRWLGSSGRLIRDSHGRPVRMTGVNFDVTQRCRAEERLREINATLEQRVADRTAEAERRAAQLAELASELTLAEQRERRRLAEVLHDGLQQIITAAAFTAQMIRNQSTDDAAGPLFDRLRGQLDEAIDCSRSLSHELSPSVLYSEGLAAALRWLAEQMQQRHGLAVRVRAADVPEPDETTRVFLYAAIRELLFNVAKHADTDSANVTLRADGDELVVVVSDEGKGFDAAAIEAEPSGLGLFSLRERIALLGGRMEVDSRPDAGSRFHLHMPLAPATKAEAPPPPPARPAPRPRRKKAAGKRRRILIVDDAQVVREGLAAILDAEPDLEVVDLADTGQRGVELAVEHRPDLVVMDVKLPDISGAEATRRILAEAPGARVVALTVYDTPGTAEAMKAAGAVAFFAKFMPPGDLIEGIRRA